MKTQTNQPIRRGVSLFSYQQLINHCMTLEDCFKDIHDMGATCIEILGNHIENYPQPSPAFVDQWFALCEKYQVWPSGYGHWCDTKLYGHRHLTDEETVDFLIRDFRLAHLLGFKNMRTKITTKNVDCDPEDGWQSYVEKALPYAEKYDVRFCTEIHDPTVLTLPQIQEYIEFIERTGTDRFGFTLDFSIFQNNKGDVPDYGDGIKVRMPKAWSSPEEIRLIMPYVYMCHGKFYYMNENFEEVTMPYPEIIQNLKANGYQGDIVSEYQGPNRKEFAHVGDQLRRHHVMLKRLLGY